MSTRKFASGVNCTMLVPYTPDDHIDFHALERMVEWYIEHGCTSLFAMCHSTELHMLSMEERLSIIHFVSEKCKSLTTIRGHRPDVIAAGTFSTTLSAMAEEVQTVFETGADAVVWITNRLDPDKNGDDYWLENAEKLLAMIPENIPLGLYECPHPCKRLLSLESVRWAVSTGRFYFIKDTCCDLKMLSDRLDIVRDTQLKLFNANAQTLLPTLRLGAAGYSSVMANIHPELYAWLCDNFTKYPEIANHLQHVLCFTAFAESLSYPLIAKYAMRCQGVPVEISSRMRDKSAFTPYHALIMDQLAELTKYEYAHLPGGTAYLQL